jgi:copper transport protein
VPVLAASPWMGGIGALLVAVAAATRRLEPLDRTVLLRVVLRRFSVVALAAVGAIAVTGTIQALVEVGTLQRLVHTAFGRSVVIKAGLLVALAGVAAAHRSEHLPRLTARLRQGESPGPVGAAVRRTLRVEALGLVAVLGVTGALAGYAPPGGAPPGPAQLDVAFEQATLRGSLAPARAGSNTLSFALARRGGDVAFDDLERVLVTATGPRGATVRAVVPGRRDGSYRVPLRLRAAGTWRLNLTLRVDAFNAFTRSVAVRVH